MSMPENTEHHGEITGRLCDGPYRHGEAHTDDAEQFTRRCYEACGFFPDGAEEPFEVDGAEVPEVRYVRELAG